MMSTITFAKRVYEIVTVLLQFGCQKKCNSNEGFFLQKIKDFSLRSAVVKIVEGLSPLDMLSTMLVQVERFPPKIGNFNDFNLGIRTIVSDLVFHQ
jgi:hypothetical protein